jgi:hypothetical protein
MTCQLAGRLSKDAVHVCNLALIVESLSCMVTAKCIWAVVAFATESSDRSVFFASFGKSPFQYTAWQAVCESITAGAEASPVAFKRTVFALCAVSLLRCLIAS